jgi:hypothetical protein
MHQQGIVQPEIQNDRYSEECCPKTNGKVWIPNEQQYDSISKIPITLILKNGSQCRLSNHFREMIRLFMTAKQPERRHYYSEDM